MVGAPRPKSPPDKAGLLYANSRHSAKLILLEKEITSVQEEIKSLDCLEPSSRCCREVNEFVFSRPDPLVATNQDHHKSNCCWTRNWGTRCLTTRGNCCCFGDKDKNSTRSSKKSSSCRQPNSSRHHLQQGCCCKLNCGSCCVNASKPKCCCGSCCGSGSRCRLKLWCNSGAKCCPGCTDLGSR